MKLEEILKKAVSEDASDIFLRPDEPPSFRVVGRVVRLDSDLLSEQDVQKFCSQMTTEHLRTSLNQDGEVDLAYQIDGIGRFRANIFKQTGRLSIVLRYVKSKVASFKDLNLPEEPLKKLAMCPRGLTLVTGIAGSGKSTTLAAMLEHINENSSKHIITIEDPIEFILKGKKSIIQQRELGSDTRSYASALKYVVRQSPDVIMIGEMRDKQTIEAALHATETGHLIFSTLHTPNAMQTVDRIINFFPPHEHDFLRLQLSQLLEGVVSLRLLATKDQASRVPAIEIMIATPTVRELLLAGKTRDLYKAIKEGGYFGCQSFNQSLKALMEKDLITEQEAINNADSPEELRLELRGITKDAGKFVR